MTTRHLVYYGCEVVYVSGFSDPSICSTACAGTTQDKVCPVCIYLHTSGALLKVLVNPRPPSVCPDADPRHETGEVGYWELPSWSAPGVPTSLSRRDKDTLAPETPWLDVSGPPLSGEVGDPTEPTPDFTEKGVRLVPESGWSSLYRVPYLRELLHVPRAEGVSVGVTPQSCRRLSWVRSVSVGAPHTTTPVIRPTQLDTPRGLRSYSRPLRRHRVPTIQTS